MHAQLDDTIKLGTQTLAALSTLELETLEQEIQSLRSLSRETFQEVYRDADSSYSYGVQELRRILEELQRVQSAEMSDASSLLRIQGLCQSATQVLPEVLSTFANGREFSACARASICGVRAAGSLRA